MLTIRVPAFANHNFPSMMRCGIMYLTTRIFQTAATKHQHYGRTAALSNIIERGVDDITERGVNDILERGVNNIRTATTDKVGTADSDIIEGLSNNVKTASTNKIGTAGNNRSTESFFLSKSLDIMNYHIFRGFSHFS